MNPHEPDRPATRPGDGAPPPHDDHADPDATAEMLDTLQAQVETLKAERDQAQLGHQRALADFQNYQRRALNNEQQAREQGVRGVLLNVIGVVDHFELALNQDPAKVTAKQVIDGVTMIKDELLRALTAQGVGVINPAPGDTFDATRHEAIMRQPAPGVEAGRVVRTLRTGYTLNDRVVRPAQVSVAPEETPGQNKDE